MSIDAMKQAREAIEWALDFIPPESETDCKCPLCTAYDALDLAIEQAERQEPVGEVLNERGDVDYLSYIPPAGTPLYTAPPQRQPHELLCVCGASWSIDGEDNEELLSTPPQRQPLTDEEIEAAWQSIDYQKPSEFRTAFARAIERAHGIGEDK